MSSFLPSLLLLPYSNPPSFPSSLPNKTLTLLMEFGSVSSSLPFLLFFLPFFYFLLPSFLPFFYFLSPSFLPLIFLLSFYFLPFFSSSYFLSLFLPSFLLPSFLLSLLRFLNFLSCFSFTLSFLSNLTFIFSSFVHSLLLYLPSTLP